MPDMVKPRHKGTPPTEPFEALMEKARSSLEAGDVLEAERLFGQATVARPASPQAWHGKGRAFALQEEWEKALRCFAIATKFDPKLADAWLGLAWAHCHLGEGGKAREALARAKALGAGGPTVAELEGALSALPT